MNKAINTEYPRYQYEVAVPIHYQKIKLTFAYKLYRKLAAAMNLTRNRIANKYKTIEFELNSMNKINKNLWTRKRDIVRIVQHCLLSESERWLVVRTPSKMRYWNGKSGNRIKGEGGVISRVERIPNNFEEIRKPQLRRCQLIEYRIEPASPSVKS